MSAMKADLPEILSPLLGGVYGHKFEDLSGFRVASLGQNDCFLRQ